MFNSDPYAVISQMDEVGAEPECIKFVCVCVCVCVCIVCVTVC